MRCTLNLKIIRIVTFTSDKDLQKGNRNGERRGGKECDASGKEREESRGVEKKEKMGERIGKERRGRGRS